MSLTKALFVLERPWRLGTPLLLSMLTIILRRFQTSTVFFLNYSHLNYTFIHCYCSSSYFNPAFFCIILYFIILHSIFIHRKLQLDNRRLMLLSSNFLSSERLYLLNNLLVKTLLFPSRKTYLYFNDSIIDLVFPLLLFLV